MASVGIEARALVAEKMLSELLEIYEVSQEKDAIEARRQSKEHEMRKWVLLKNHLSKTGDLLDCGFGSGRDLLIASELGYNGFGCELCEKYYTRFKTDFPDFKEKVRLEDMRNLSFEDSSFDIVRHNASFLHMPLLGKGYTIHKALNESWRVLRPGGTIYVYTKAGTNFCLIDTKEGFGPRPFQLFTKNLMYKTLMECGFSVTYLEIIKKERVSQQLNGEGKKQIISWVEAIARKIG